MSKITYAGVNFNKIIFAVVILSSLICGSFALTRFASYKIIAENDSDFKKYYSVAMKEWSELSRQKKALALSVWKTSIVNNDPMAASAMSITHRTADFESVLEEIGRSDACRFNDYKYNIGSAEKVQVIERDKDLNSLRKGAVHPIILIPTQVTIDFIDRDLKCANYIEKLISQYAPGIVILSKATISTLVKDGSTLANVRLENENFKISFSWQWFSWAYELN